MFIPIPIIVILIFIIAFIYVLAIYLACRYGQMREREHYIRMHRKSIRRKVEDTPHVQKDEPGKHAVAENVKIVSVRPARDGKRNSR